ncbi:Uncharacterised protein [Mycolicibacterium vanbaalenii]|uniref:Minor tail protein n=1 Tax=Mycolicibacterium vanbaalenii TaxID=110539 RepID=A0A5S9MMX3_MYCVN|nr:hypothetical protein [Mycolicibacterium vanbaalenii]CAA0078265.1 Uncharacterised protein [Mycolicibacterium vanbaalenii]
MFRGFFSLNGIEIANSSRVVAHLGRDEPVSDAGMFGGDQIPTQVLVEDPPGSGLYVPETDEDAPLLYDTGDMVADEDGLYPLTLGPCGLPEADDYLDLYEIPGSSTELRPGLWSPPDGARRYGPGLMVVDGTCWGAAAICESCAVTVAYDDSWPGLQEFLDDPVYRPELAPWYSVELPESGEFGGVWVMKVDGWGAAPVERPITQMAGPGAVAGPHRDASRTLTFDALLIGCTNAGVVYGLQWLSCLLRDTNTMSDSVLRYLAASPQGSGVDPASLLRDAHGAVLTRSPRVTEQFVTTRGPNQQANVFRVQWELTVLSPYAYFPAVTLDADWDEIARQPVNWVHAADCTKPDTCLDMPVLFSTECVPEQIAVINTPPPVCGGCLPVGEIDKYSYRVPTMDYAFRCRETAVTTIIRNTGESSLTLQAFWRICGTDIRCEDNRWPLQVSGLPAGAELVLDGISGRYWAYYDGRRHKVKGVVGTPHGAPWRPPLIDRQTCWDFIVQTAASSEFEVSFSLADREP